MAGLLYYIPGAARTITRNDWLRAGLGHAFVSTPAARGCQHGPRGTAGVVLADPRYVADVGYYPDRQRWRSAAGGAYHVGLVDADPPCPADLEKSEILPGHAVTLGDGKDYVIPVARALTDQDGELVYRVNLPSTIERNGDGHWHRGEVVPGWRSLWAIAEQWWTVKNEAIQAQVTGDEEDAGSQKISIDFDGLYDGAAAALAANYRVGTDEISLMGLFDGDCGGAILDALVDWPVYIEWLKKKLTASSPPARDGSPIGAGAPDGIPVTAQA